MSRSRNGWRSPNRDMISMQANGAAASPGTRSQAVAEGPHEDGDWKKKYMRKYWLAAVLVVVAGCSSGPTAQNGAAGGSSGDKSGAADGNAIHLTLHKVMDTEGTGKLAGTFLLPDGYTSTDVVKWIPNDYLTPVTSDITVKSDDGQTVMEWMTGLQIDYTHSPLGSTGIDPPKSVCEFLLQNWKKNHPGVDFTVVNKADTSVPEDSHELPGLGKMWGNRGIVELQYVKDGTTFHVKCHARIDVQTTGVTAVPTGGTVEEGGWLILNDYTVTAPESKFPDAMKLFGIVLTSCHTDKHFYNTMMQASEIIMKNFYAGERQAMETSRIISQTNDEILDSMNKSYETSQAANEHEATGFDDYIRGVDRYNEGDGEEVTLPAGYNHAWSDGFGKYIVTDDHTYNPNVGGPNGDWKELEKQQ